MPSRREQIKAVIAEHIGQKLEDLGMNDVLKPEEAVAISQKAGVPQEFRDYITVDTLLYQLTYAEEQRSRK